MQWLRFSKAFYSGPHGYKMCLGVFPCGDGEGKGMHISLFVYMLRGENDSELKWPFRGSVVLELLNQQADHTSEPLSNIHHLLSLSLSLIVVT